MASWERFLNQPGARQSLVSRWLYEHLFLAHLYFPEQGAPGHFFQLVRSRTPSGQPIDRSRPGVPTTIRATASITASGQIQGVIVHKTHITYPLTAKKLERVQELFFGTQWNTDKVPGVLEPRQPVRHLCRDPATARYQFMLDNAEYFTRTFIRGPVPWTDLYRRDPRQLLGGIPGPRAGPVRHRRQLPRAERAAAGLAGADRRAEEPARPVGAYRDKRNEYEDLARTSTPTRRRRPGTRSGTATTTPC